MRVVIYDHWQLASWPSAPPPATKPSAQDDYCHLAVRNKH